MHFKHHSIGNSGTVHAKGGCSNCKGSVNVKGAIINSNADIEVTVEYCHCENFIGRQFLKGDRRAEVGDQLKFMSCANYSIKCFDNKLDNPLIPSNEK